MIDYKVMDLALSVRRLTYHETPPDQDLDKNPLVSDIRAEIKTLQGQVSGPHNEYSRLVLEEKKWVNYERTLSIRPAKVKATKLVHSDETGVLVMRLVKASIIRRCMIFEEVAEFKELFILEKMPGYCSSLKEEYDRAGDDMANASYPFLTELTADLYAFVEQLLSKK
nr:hypothetical protein [Tanacetum cinerariifolium]